MGNDNSVKPNLLKLKGKQAIMVWLAIYPTITIIFFFFGAQLQALPFYLRTLVLTLVLVPLMVFILLPLIQKLFAKLGW